MWTVQKKKKGANDGKGAENNQHSGGIIAGQKRGSWVTTRNDKEFALT